MLRAKHRRRTECVRSRTKAGHKADLAPERQEARLTDFAHGKAFDDLETAVTRALAAMPKGELTASINHE